VTKTFTARTARKAPTDTKGSVITVYAEGRQQTVPWDYNADDPHRAAVLVMFPGATLKHRGTTTYGHLYVVTIEPERKTS
jgi:hypothetical protein